VNATTGLRRRSARTAALLLTFVLALGASPAAAGATAADDDVPESIDAIEQLADDTAPLDDTPIGVAVDRNGDAPGGVEVLRVHAPAESADELAEHLESIDGVIAAAPDTRLRATVDPDVARQWGPARVRANLLPSTADGLGTVVAVIDSGVQGSHPDLTPQLRNGAARVLTGTSFLRPAVDGDPDLTGQPGNVDPHGHGTHVAGIVSAARDNGIGGAGVAPGAQILPVRVLDSSGNGWESDVAQGILWAHQQGADVINLSLSGPSAGSTVAAAIDHVTSDTSRGKPATIVFAAAGNAGPSSPVQYPAAFPSAIAVAATDSTGTVASFSSHGDYVDLAAPGSQIWSTCISGSPPFCSRSGTSMATPLAAGAAAILRQQTPAAAPGTIRNRLTTNARDVVAPGWDRATGYGEIDLAAAYSPSTWPPFPRIPAPPPAPVNLPWGKVEAAFVEGRRMVLAGRVHDPEGTVPVYVDAAGLGRIGTWPDAEGRWLAVWDAPPGTWDACAWTVDAPTGAGVVFGCYQLVVK
jgi:subtilisin family serine protease